MYEGGYEWTLHTAFSGLLTMLGPGLRLSTNRLAINLRKRWSGVWACRIVFAVFSSEVELAECSSKRAGDGVNRLLSTLRRIEIRFGELGAQGSPWDLFFAFQVLPTVIFYRRLLRVLYHYGIMQLIIKLAAKV